MTVSQTASFPASQLPSYRSRGSEFVILLHKYKAPKHKVHTVLIMENGRWAWVRTFDVGLLLVSEAFTRSGFVIRIYYRHGYMDGVYDARFLLDFPHVPPSPGLDSPY